MAFCGNIASIMKASSPHEAIIMAVNAPKLMILWVYRDTDANPPMHPGMSPSRVEMITCPILVRLRPENISPLDSMFRDSIIIIIMTTSPVISMELRIMSISISGFFQRITGEGGYAGMASLIQGIP